MKFSSALPKDYEPDFGDEPEAPAQDPTPAPEAAPVQGQPEPAVRSAQPDQAQHPIASDPGTPSPVKFEEALPDDYEPDFGEPPAEGAAPAGAPPKRSYIGAAGNAFFGSLKQAIPDTGAAADALNTFSGGDPNSFLGGVAGYLQGDPNAPNSNQREVPTLRDIPGEGIGDTISRAGTYAVESAAGAAGSTMPSLVGGVVGGIAGEAIDPLGGGVPGAWVGAATPSIIQGIGGLWNDLQQDEGVKSLMDSGQLTKAQLSNYAVMGGTVVGAIDAIGAEHFLPGGEAVKGATQALVKENIKKAILKGISEGALAEGGTEALQEIISQGIQGVVGGNADLVNRAWSVVDNMVQGALGGSSMGGVKEGSAAAINNAKVAATTAAPPGAQAPPATPNAAGGQPTPGVVGGSATPPQPVGAAPQHTAPAPVKATPQSQNQAAAKTSTPVVVAPGTPAADQNAALNPQPMPNVKTVDLNHPNVTDDPNYVEPSTPEDEEVYDETDDTERPTTAPTTVTPEPNTGLTTGDVDQANAAALNVSTPAPTAQPKTAKEIADAIIAAHTNTVSLPADQKPAIETPALGVAPAIQPQVQPQANEGSAAETELQGQPATAEEVQPEEVAGPPAEAAQQVGAPAAVEEAQPADVANPPVSAEPSNIQQTQGMVSTEGAEPQAFAAEFAVTKKPPRRGRKAEPQKVIEPVTPSRTPKAQAAIETAERRAQAATNVATEEDAGPPHTEISRALVDIAHSDEDMKRLSPDKRFDDIADRAARDVAEFADNKPDKRTGKKKSRAEHIADLIDQMKHTIKSRFEDLAEADRQRGEAKKTEEEAKHELAREVNKNRRVSTGTGQERARTRNQTKEAGAIATETDQSTARRLRKRDASSLTKEEKLWLKAYNKRASMAKGSGESVVNKRKPFTKAMAKVRDRWVAAQKPVDEAKEQTVQKRASNVREVQDAINEAAERGEELSDEQIEEITKEAEAKAAEPAIRERREKGQQAAGGVIDEIDSAHRQAAANDRTINKDAAFLGRGKVKAFVARVKAALAKLKLGELPTTVDSVRYSPEENIAIYANRILSGAEPDASVDDIALAKHILDVIKTGEATHADLYSLMRKLRESDHQELMDHHGVVLQTRRKAAAKMEMDDIGDVSGAATTDAPNVDENTFTFTDDNGNEQSIPVHSRVSGEQALAHAAKVNPAWKTWGPMKLFRRMHLKRLREMVGDTPILFVSGEHMKTAANGRTPFGQYMSPSTADIAKGAKPVVLIDIDKFNARSKQAQAHVIEHELTHAATAFAIRHNYRGAREIASKMFDALHAQLEAAGIDASKIYGMKDIDEMIAEAHSSEEFQKLLSGLTMPKEIADRIGLPSADKAPTWWQGMISLVRRALGMDLAPKGTMSYLEGVMSMNPDMMMSTIEQRERAQNDFDESFPIHGDYYGRNGQESESKYTDFGDAFSFSAMHQHAFNDSMAKAAKRSWSSVTDKLMTINHMFFKTTGQLQRDAADILGSYQNDLSEYGETLMTRDTLVQDLQAEGNNLAGEISEAFSKDMAGTQAMIDSVNQSSETGTDPSMTLAQNIVAKNVSRAGIKDRAKRKAHRQARADFLALTHDQQVMWKKIVKFYKDQEESRRDALVDNILEGAIDNQNITLPAGMTQGEVKNFVLSGDIDKPIANMTPRQQQIMGVLGSTGLILQKNSHLRSIKGVYVPLTRQGKFVMSARERLQTPAGATVLPQTNTEQIFAFRNKKDAENYIDTTDHKTTAIRPTTVDATTGDTHDPVTGVKYTLKDNNTVTEFRVHAQDKSVHMSDNQAELEELREHLEANGHDTGSVNLLSDEINPNSTLLPLHVQQLLNSVAQSNKSTVQKDAAKAGIVDAFIRTMNGSRAQHRSLKRANIAGYSKDMINTILSTNRAMANHIANMKMMPKLAKHDKDINEMFKAMTGQKSSKVVPLQRIFAEMNRRRDSAYKNNGRTGGFKRVMDAALQLSFMTHLASFSFSVYNQTQLAVVTGPVFAAEHGIGATAREMMEAAKTIGVIKNWGIGIAETARELGDLGKKSWKLAAHNESMPRTKVFSHFNNAVKNITNQVGLANKQVLLDAMQKLRDVGGATDSGLDTADMSEYGKTRLEKGLHRSARAARMLSDAVEANNRYVTLISAVQLAKKKGMSDKQAIDYAISKVEQTQGIYSGVNNPTVMSSPFGKVVTQFKKFPLMMAQLFYGNFAKAIGINRNVSGQQRVEAAKQLAYLSGMGLVMSGTLGSPFMEMARMANLFSQIIMGGDDWDKQKSDMELDLQKFFNYIGLGSYSEKTAEILMHGASRSFGIDTQSRLGNDNLFFFGDPKSVSGPDMLLWGANQMLGAPGQVAMDTYTAYQTGDMSKLPLPKLVKDFIKAQQSATVGRKSPSGATVYEKPSGWNVGNILRATTGIAPSAPQRQYEAGGSFIKNKEKQAGKADRTKALQTYLNASDKDAAWEKIKQFNKGKSGKDAISMSDIMKAKKRRETDARKQEMAN